MSNCPGSHLEWSIKDPLNKHFISTRVSQRNKELLKVCTLSSKHIIFIHYGKTALLQEQNTYGINLFRRVFMINCANYKAHILSNSQLVHFMSSVYVDLNEQVHIHVSQILIFNSHSKKKTKKPLNTLIYFFNELPWAIEPPPPHIFFFFSTATGALGSSFTTNMGRLMNLHALAACCPSNISDVCPGCRVNTGAWKEKWKFRVIFTHRSTMLVAWLSDYLCTWMRNCHAVNTRRFLYCAGCHDAQNGTERQDKARQELKKGTLSIIKAVKPRTEKI